MSRPACARIDLAALRHNFSVARKAAPHSQIIAVIKANAYGHGVLQCAQALSDAHAFAVAGLDEAIVLRDGGFSQRLMLLGGIFHVSELDEAARLKLDLVVHDDWQIAALRDWRGVGCFDVWLKVDTGMHRLGIAPARLKGALADLQLAGVGRVRLMTHLACADEPGSQRVSAQLRQMQSCIEYFSGETSIANSAGVLGWPAARTDWVRPGIMLYGSSPFVAGDAAAEGLQPVMHLESQLIAVRELAAGESVGYGANWTAEKPVRMGVVAMGYGDGYPRHLGTGTPVLVDGVRARLIGRVSMDLITVDLTDLPAAQVGSAVCFWGEGLPADEIADRAGTIAYELFTGINPRVQRLYTAVNA